MLTHLFCMPKTSCHPSIFIYSSFPVRESLVLAEHMAACYKDYISQRPLQLAMAWDYILTNGL